jgi:hypothetical protein
MRSPATAPVRLSPGSGSGLVIARIQRPSKAGSPLLA